MLLLRASSLEIVYIFFGISATSFLGERAKNGGVLGEEFFCPRADGFSCPPPTAAGNSSG